MQKIRGAALLAATALAASGLVACGGEEEPAESSSTASPSAPETSSEASGSDTSGSSDGGGEGEVAELPAAAKKQTKEGAIAFNEFYQHQLGESLRTGDTATIEEYTHDCDVCENFNEKTKANRSKGITMDRNPYSAHNVTATPRVDSGMKVSMTVKSSGYSEVLADDSKGREAEPTSYKLVTDTQWHDGHWVIHDTVITR